MRGLSKTFISTLKSGFLQPVLNLVILDSTLCLEIRQKCAEIYYRGGVILKIDERGDSFNVSFDKKYLVEDSTRVPKELPSRLAGSDDVKKWTDVVLFLKHEMDLWFMKHPKNEREFQQLMIRENNFGKSAKSTDYFICDIEYQSPNGRFDLIAVHWPSSPTGRKNNKNLGLAFMEMKYLDSALTGNAGLQKHVEDINRFLGERKNLIRIKKEMKKIFNQKLELELINNEKLIKSFNDNKPEYILALVNHDPDSRVLRQELNNLPPCPYAELKFAVSNFMGYGLYDQNIYTLDSFLRRFEDQI
ncbi:MAG: hypothetical protein ACETWQ_17065 [Phycisphaerae bacterium]